MEPHPVPATSSTQQAFGPIHFGMKGAHLHKASTQLRVAGQGKITAALLRQSLVTNGVKTPGHLAHRDHAIRLDMRYSVGRPLHELTFQTHQYYPAAEYESALRPVWETLQDIADSKFARTTKKAVFPSLAAIRKSGKVFVSDTWQAAGVRVELGILAGTFYGDPTPKYAAMLKVTGLPHA